MKKAAIIYLATGEYIKFWNGFYDSFEKNFLPEGWEKHYYVITNQEDIYQQTNERVHIMRQEHYPWPLIALLKFYIALRAEEELKNYDYVLQINANLICESVITEEEIMPRPEKGERISCVVHAGIVADKKNYNHKCYYEFERNPKSKAYIPYNAGHIYVYASGVGGKGSDYVDFLHEITNRTIEDLKYNIIPKWHDESYVNHYVNTHSDVRFLHPGYCYPVGFEIPYERKIVGVSKIAVFDIHNFKGYYAEPKGSLWKRLVRRVVGRMRNRVLPVVYYVRDTVLCRKPAE